MNIIRKAVLAGVLGAATLAVASPAMADDGRYRGHRGGGDTAGAALAGGIIGLALGAAIASGDRDRYDDGYYYDRRYRQPQARVYVYREYPRYRGHRERRHYRHYEPRGHYGDGYYGRGW